MALSEAQTEFIEDMQEARAAILSASGKLDAIEGHGPGGEHAIGAALSAIDGAIAIEQAAD